MINKIFSISKNLSFVGLSKFFFYLFFAFVPFRIDALFWTRDLYASGFFNQYTSHFIYIGDVFLILSLFCLGLAFVFNSRGVIFERVGIGNPLLFSFVILFFLMNVLSISFSVDPVNSGFYALRIFEFLIVYFLLTNRFVQIEKLLYVFIGVMVFESFVGIFQYLFQNSVGLSFLGESVISPEIAGVAKLDLFGETFVRAYGTFAHPNIFAGFLIFAIFFIIYFLRTAKTERRIFFSLLLIVCGLAFVLTFSRGAFLALFAATLLYYAVSNLRISLKYVLITFALIAFFVFVFDLSSLLIGRFVIGDAASFSERSQFLDIGKRMFLDNIFGVGAGNFTAVMQHYSPEKILPWIFQPVHNIYMLVLNELGIQGFLVFAFMFVYLFLSLLKILPHLDVKKHDFIHILMGIWVAIFVIGLFDHYFISLYQGQALFWLFVGITASR